MSERIEKLARGGIVAGGPSFAEMGSVCMPLDTAAIRPPTPPDPPMLPPMQIAVSPAERTHLEAMLRDHFSLARERGHLRS
jgi:hypothetical protein